MVAADYPDTARPDSVSILDSASAAVGSFACGGDGGSSMHRYFVSACVGVATGAALVTMGMAGANNASGSARVSAAPAFRSATRPGSQLWAKRYSAGGAAYAQSSAVSPDGKSVFVTGFGQSGYATVAYNTSSGARKWVEHFGGDAQAYAVAVSPGGGTVFVTGWTDHGGVVGYATIAYSAATGARRWVQHYTGPKGYADQARAVTVSPNGKTVFVTGVSYLTNTAYDYATVAYNSATGARRWVRRYVGNGSYGPGAAAPGGAYSTTVSPDGTKVFVTGDSRANYATVAYNAATGVRLWARRYISAFGGTAYSVGVTPDGRAVFVTGESWGLHNGFDYATVAYDSRTGRQLWAKRYNGPGNYDDNAFSLAVSPKGTTVFVTGQSNGKSGLDFATIAYDASTGSEKWLARYAGSGKGIDSARSLAVSPTGSSVYVTGPSSGTRSYQSYATVAYTAATGARRWASRYGHSGVNWATSIAVSPTNGRVFVTGYSGAPSAFATVAYRG